MLGLDVGDKRIGVALGDDEVWLASPLTTLFCKGIPDDYHAIADLARVHAVSCFVIGLPLSMDGSLGSQGRKIQWFARGLRAMCAVPVTTWDERLTTVEADRRLREIGVSGHRDKGRRDAVAAALLLQSYLDARRRVTS